MRTITNWILCLVLCSISLFSWAQESALYRDYQKTYKKGMHFYQQKLYAAALQELDKVVAQKDLFQDTDVPFFILSSELHAGLAALYTQQKDAQKRLIYFIEKNEPSSVANKARLAMGNYYYDQRNYTLAIKYLSKISYLDLTNIEIIEHKFKLAYCYFVKKKFKQAEALFFQIKEAKTIYYYPANYYYGIIKFFDKNYEDALSSFQKVQASSRYQKIVPSYICQIYFAKKQYQQLIAYGQPLVDKKDLREAQQIAQLLGQSYFETANYTKALPYLETYVAKSNRVSKEALYQLGFTQYKVGKFDKALENFGQLNDLNNQMGQSALYSMADCLLKTNNKSAARQAFQKASQLDFDQDLKEDAMINYAKLSFEQGFDSDAVLALEYFNDKSSAYYNEAQNLLAKVLINTRDYDVALDLLRNMRTKTQTLKETHQKIAYFRGVQWYSNAAYSKAIQLFNESINIGIHQETIALSHFWKAEGLFKLAKYDASISEYFKFNLLAKTQQQLPANSTLAVSNYGLGYGYLKKGDFGNAARYFGQSVSYIKPRISNINDAYVTDFVYPDALIRSGDCLLYLRDFSRAKGYYNTIINKKYPNQDYAMFQLSLIHNIQNKSALQIALLDKIINNFPSSLYADDALYAKGNAYLIQNDKDNASFAFEQLIRKYPNSSTANKAMLKLGLIAYAQNNNAKALQYYEEVFRSYPQSEEGSDALAALKEIYIESGNPDGYFQFINSVQGFEIDELEKDSLMYQSAQRQFDNGDWELAVASYSSYLTKFPTGIHSLQAHFNRGESFFDLKRYEEALSDYAYISDNGNQSFAEIANHRAANICYFSTQNFGEALRFYLRLEKVASSADMLFESQQFGMRSSFYAGQLDSLPTIAERFMNNERATTQDHAEANYYIGKSRLAQQQYAAALTAFNKNIELSGDDVRSAESRYWRAYIAYENRDLDKAMDLCFQNNKEIPAHPYWLVKSFILLADIYAEKGNLFQAKATLQSIVDNYTGDQELMDEASQKLKLVKEAEANKSKLKRENPNDEMEMIEEN